MGLKMADLIHRRTRRMNGSGGREYDVLVFANQVDGHWEGWLEFHPSGGGGLVLRTDREAKHRSLAELQRWATSLEPGFLEGAFGRAFDKASQ